MKQTRLEAIEQSIERPSELCQLVVRLAQIEAATQIAVAPLFGLGSHAGDGLQ